MTIKSMAVFLWVVLHLPAEETRQFNSLRAREKVGGWATGSGSPSLFWKWSSGVLLSDRRNGGRRLDRDKRVAMSVICLRTSASNQMGEGILLKQALFFSPWLNKLCQLREQNSGMALRLCLSLSKFPCWCVKLAGGDNNADTFFCSTRKRGKRWKVGQNW